MWQQGARFFCSANGVWLTSAVPSAFIEFPNDDAREENNARSRPDRGQ
jgi:RNA:NAD 2'-phosphotransferase (TPT1/KptA family)